MNVQDFDNEVKAIMTLIGFHDKPRAYLAAFLRPDHFSDPRTVAMYTRIMAMVKSRNEMPTFETMQHDTLLSDEARELLDSSAYPPAKTEGDAEQLHFALETMRKSRVIMEGLGAAFDYMGQDNIDPEDAFPILEKMLLDARTDQSDETLECGADGNFIEATLALLRRKKPDTIPTGFHEYDADAGGLPRGGLTTLAASSGGGKSTMAVQIGVNAVRAGYNAAIVTLEMSKDQTTGRLDSHLSGVDYGAINRAALTNMQKDVINREAGKWQAECEKLGKRLSIFHRSRATLSEIALEMRSLNYDLIIIDYINLLTEEEGANKNSNDAKILGDMAKEAKIQSRMGKAAWVMLAQLNEQGDVKYSKAIKEHSDVMLTWVYGDAEKESHLVEIFIAKSRHGRSFKFPLVERFKVQKFDNPGKPDNAKDVAIKKGKKGKGTRHPTAKPMFGGDLEDDDDDL
jgi:RecA/RadA recombinase